MDEAEIYGKLSDQVLNLGDREAAECRRSCDIDQGAGVGEAFGGCGPAEVEESAAGT